MLREIPKDTSFRGNQYKVETSTANEVTKPVSGAGPGKPRLSDQERGSVGVVKRDTLSGRSGGGQELGLNGTLSPCLKKDQPQAGGRRSVASIVRTAFTD